MIADLSFVVFMKRRGLSHPAPGTPRHEDAINRGAP